jgi:hypothetical protein
MISDDISPEREEMDNEIDDEFRKIGPAILSLVNKVSYVKGPQINIENFHLDLSTKNFFPGVSLIIL